MRSLNCNSSSKWRGMCGGVSNRCKLGCDLRAVHDVLYRCRLVPDEDIMASLLANLIIYLQSSDDIDNSLPSRPVNWLWRPQVDGQPRQRDLRRMRAGELRQNLWFRSRAGAQDRLARRLPSAHFVFTRSCCDYRVPHHTEAEVTMRQSMNTILPNRGAVLAGAQINSAQRAGKPTRRIKLLVDRVDKTAFFQLIDDR